MSELRIKVKFGDFEIELQGEKDTVKEEFKELKEKGLENLLSKLDHLPTGGGAGSSVDKGASNSNRTGAQNYPAMKEIILKQLPQSEAEWVLLYAFYSTDYGTKYFSHPDIVAMYDTTSRKTNNRLANLSNNFKSLFKSDFLTAVNDEEYLVTETGKQAVSQILSRAPGKGQNSPKSTKTKSSSNAKESSNNGSNNNSAKSKDFKLLTDLSLKPHGKTSLIDYVGSYQTSSYPEKILLIVNYLKEVLKIEKVSMDHVFTGLREIKERIPASLDNIISKTKSRNGYLKFDSRDDISVSVKGADYIIHDLKRK